ncbi:hypothetical protein KUCAC02_019264, partial [Chaenocephalus aceratus]
LLSHNEMHQSRHSPLSECVSPVGHSPLSECVSPVGHSPLSECVSPVGHSPLSECVSPVGHSPLSECVSPDTVLSDTVLSVCVGPVGHSPLSVCLSRHSPLSECVSPVGHSPLSECVSPDTVLSVCVSPVGHSPLSECVGPVGHSPLSECVGPVGHSPLSECVGPVGHSPLRHSPLSECVSPVGHSPLSECVGPVLRNQLNVSAPDEPGHMPVRLLLCPGTHLSTRGPLLRSSACQVQPIVTEKKMQGRRGQRYLHLYHLSFSNPNEASPCPPLSLSLVASESNPYPWPDYLDTIAQADGNLTRPTALWYISFDTELSTNTVSMALKQTQPAEREMY